MAILEGPYIPGVVGPALHRLVACALNDDVSASDRRYRVTAAISDPRYYQSSRRIWWRCSHGPHSDAHYYISINPGQFSTTRPDDPDALFRECPSLDGIDGLSDEISQFLKLGDPFQNALLDPRISSLVAIARQIDDGTYGLTVVSSVAQFDAAARHGQRGNRQKFKDAIQSLFETCLFGFAMPTQQFSQCMLLLQLQSMTQQWIEQDCYSDPAGYLRNYFHLVHPTAGSKLIDALRDIGNGSYRQAVACVSQSLKAEFLVAQQKQLVHAMSSYIIAVQVAGLAVEVGTDFGLQYQPVNADEGAACAYSGLFCGLHGLLHNIDYFARGVSAVLESGGEWSPSKEVHGLSSHVFPVFPRYLAQLIIGRALTLKPNGRFQEGLNHLLDLQGDLVNQTSWESAFEGNYLDHCLLNAYLTSGDQVQAKTYAYRLAGKMVVETALKN